MKTSPANDVSSIRLCHSVCLAAKGKMPIYPTTRHSLLDEITIHASDDAMETSQSLARRRHRLSHARVRSTTQRRGRIMKPVRLDRLMISTVSRSKCATPSYQHRVDDNEQAVVAHTVEMVLHRREGTVVKGGKSLGSCAHWHPVDAIYWIASHRVRALCLRGRPTLEVRLNSGRMTAHSSSVQSLA
jgi:hypothetical protein